MARWSGPPPLLIAATVLGVVVALTAGGSDDEPRSLRATTVADTAGPAASSTSSAAPTTPASSAPTSSPTATPTVTPRSAPTGTPSEEPGDVLAPPLERPSGPVKRQLLGLATFNQDRSLSRADAREDAVALTRRKGVSIVGWQEGEGFGPVYSLLKRQGWDTYRATVDDEPIELAVSWRRSRFELASTVLHPVVYRAPQGRTPYAPRYVLRVTLREKASRRLVTVVDTHLPPVLEGIERRGQYRNPVAEKRGRIQLRKVDTVFDRTPGHWVLGTGDYGFGAQAEIAEQPWGGISRMLAGTALSTYAVLGTSGIDPTDTTTARYADYVHLDRVQLDAGHIEVLGQRTLGAINSDHRPLIAWLALS